jgi:hypothetical protein
MSALLGTHASESLHSRLAIARASDYLLSLKSLSNHADPTPYLRAMTRIQRWTSAFDYDQPRQALYQDLKGCNAFEEDLRNFRLIFPN